MADLVDGPRELTEAEAAEERRSAQRAELRALRRQRLAAAAPWVAVVALLVAAAACTAFALRVTTVPGAGLTGSSSAGTLIFERALPATGTALVSPAGIAVSGDRLYIADPRRGVVDVFTRDGSRVATIGAGWLKTPAYVAVGPVDGRVYVSDRTRGEVGVFASTGARFGLLTPAGLRPKATSGPAWRPLSLAFAPDGTLYVADSGSTQSIVVFSPDGSLAGTLGAGVPAGRTGQRFAFVNGISATADRVVVADSNNGRLLVFDRSGRFRSAIPWDGLPRGLFVTSTGQIVVTDAASDAVSLLDPSGKVVQTLAGGVGEREQFASPGGVAGGSDGLVYVVDAVTGRVFVLRAAGGSAAAVARARVSSTVLLVVAALCLALAAILGFVTVRRSRVRVRVRDAQVTL